MAVEDVEEVLAVWIAALRKPVGEVPHQVGVALHLREQVDHAELIVPGHCDPLHLRQGQKRLLLGQNLPEEVLGDHRRGRDVELKEAVLRVGASLPGDSP